MASHGSDFTLWRERAAAEWPMGFAELRERTAAATLRRRHLLQWLLPCVAANDDRHAAWIMRTLYPESAHTLPLAVSPMASLADWCSAHGAACRVVLPPQPVSIPQTSPYTKFYEYTTEAAVLASLPQASWLPGWDFVLGADKTVIADSGYMPITYVTPSRPHKYYADAGAVIHYAPREQVFVPGETLYLSAPYVGHMGHWIVDFLPRLMGREYLGTGVKIAVPSDITEKQIESLALFGVAEQSLILCDTSKAYVFEMLHCYRPGNYIPPNPVHARYVRERLSTPRAPTPGKRIFLSRKSVQTRLAANDVEFRACLAEQGFIEADMADLSFAEQARLLNDAEVLLGLFGSNLLANYQAPADCTVIGVTDAPDDDPTIPHTCFLFGQRHQFLVSEAAADPGHKRYKNDRDLLVDCEELRRRLRTL
jgi:capsular polysaccharide biosynthesis protein